MLKGIALGMGRDLRRYEMGWHGLEWIGHRMDEHWLHEDPIKRLVMNISYRIFGRLTAVFLVFQTVRSTISSYEEITILYYYHASLYGF